MSRAIEFLRQSWRDGGPTRLVMIGVVLYVIAQAVRLVWAFRASW